MEILKTIPEAHIPVSLFFLNLEFRLLGSEAGLLLAEEKAFFVIYKKNLNYQQQAET